MSHVDEGTLHALVDNELEAGERAAVEAHLASCASCAQQFAEASAMARQVVTLLSTLDHVAAPVTMQPAAPRPVPATASAVPAPSVAVTPIRRRIMTLRRVALAASVLLVAGVSYQVGLRRESAAMPAVASNATSVRLGAAAVPLAAPAASVAAQDSLVPPAPAVISSQEPRGGPRAEPDAIMAEHGAASTDVAPAEQKAAPATPMPAATQQAPAAQLESQQSVVARAQSRDMQMGDRADAAQRSQSAAPATDMERATQRIASPALRAAPATAMAASENNGAAANAAPARAATKATSGAPILPKAIPLAGYAVVEDVALPTVARRRYVAPDGASVLLVVIRGVDENRKERRDAASSEFVVSTVRGRSIVRWRRQGLDYELQGTIAADSLMKLAVQFR